MLPTFSDALQQEVNQGQHDEEKQQKNLPNAHIFHNRLPYFFGAVSGWFPVSAIASRMAVSACTFFIL